MSSRLLTSQKRMLIDFYMIDFYQIIKFFDEHSPSIVAISTITLAVIISYYAKQTRFLTKNQLRPAFTRSLIASTHNSEMPFEVRLLLKNVGIGAAFNIHVEYSIVGIKNSKQREMIHDIECGMIDYITLIQNGQPLRYDGSTNRVIQFKLKYEGISGKYDTKFQLKLNEYFPDR
jgi:hypothetical protein